MKIWGVPFHVIESEWTDDQFYAMFDRLGERIEAEEKAQKRANKKSSGGSVSDGSNTRTRDFTPQQFIQKIGGTVPKET